MILLGMLLVTQPVKKVPLFMAPEDSIPCGLDVVTDPYPKPVHCRLDGEDRPHPPYNFPIQAYATFQPLRFYIEDGRTKDSEPNGNKTVNGARRDAVEETSPRCALLSKRRASKCNFI
jgi:hypothetical protein